MDKLRELLRDYGIEWHTLGEKGFYESYEREAVEKIKRINKKKKETELTAEIMAIPMERMRTKFVIKNPELFVERGGYRYWMENVPPSLFAAIGIGIEQNKGEVGVVTQLFPSKRLLLFSERNERQKDFFNFLSRARSEKNKLATMFDRQIEKKIAREEMDAFLIDLREDIEESYAMKSFLNEYACIVEEWIEQKRKTEVEKR